MADVPPLDATGSGDLVRRAQGGDRSSFDALIRRSEHRLVRLVHARMGPGLRQFEESRDLVQPALTEAGRALPQFEYRGEGAFLPETPRQAARGTPLNRASRPYSRPTHRPLPHHDFTIAA